MMASTSSRLPVLRHQVQLLPPKRRVSKTYVWVVVQIKVMIVKRLVPLYE